MISKDGKNLNQFSKAMTISRSNNVPILSHYLCNTKNTNLDHSKACFATETKNHSKDDVEKENFSKKENHQNQGIQPMDRRVLFQYLQLKTYSDEEIDNVFDEIHSFGSEDEKGINTNALEHSDKLYITHDHVSKFLLNRIGQIQDRETRMNQIDPDSNALVNTIDCEKYQRMKDFADMEARNVLKLFQNNDTSSIHEHKQYESPSTRINKVDFKVNLRDLATEIDMKHTIPISVSMLLVGSSVGIVIPIMPYVVSNLGLTAGQYGMVVSSFALAKLFANVPAAIMVEQHGRKPYLVYSLVIVSMGVGGIGLATQFEHLVVCRVLTGLGVSALSTAATLTIADCSTPLNRASTMAPMMSAFAAGTALGPAIGGFLGDRVGIHSTFYLVGCIYLTLTAINNIVLNETKLPSVGERVSARLIQKDENGKEGENGISSSHAHKANNNEKESKEMVNLVGDALSQWSPLLKIEKVRNVILMNGFYWAALSGSQMTLLPLILTDPSGLAFTATSVGKVYMGMSLVQVLGNPTMAKHIDKIGKVPSIVTGCGLLSTSIFLLPFCTEMNEVATTCAFWALGSTMLSTAPVSYISDNVSDHKRAQAIALLRTVGDVGFLVGAVSSGAVADAFDMDVAMHSSSFMLLSATGWFTARSLLAMQASDDGGTGISTRHK